MEKQKITVKDVIEWDEFSIDEAIQAMKDMKKLGHTHVSFESEYESYYVDAEFYHERDETDEEFNDRKLRYDKRTEIENKQREDEAKRLFLQAQRILFGKVIYDESGNPLDN